MMRGLLLVNVLVLLGLTAYVVSAQTDYTEPYRPQYHFSASTGWLGDPNGMIRYNDLYHVFWWGHATSPDLVHWTEQRYPMAGADGSFDYFSGSVVVDEQNTSGLAQGESAPLIAIYTMHERATEAEAQGLSVSQDGITFEYFDGNPVLDTPEAVFRDPQVWWDADHQRWLMIIALPERHRVRFYASPDLQTWEHLSDFGPVGARANWWEVPDLIQVSVAGDPNTKRWVLMCGMGPNSVQYFVGNWDGTQFILDPEANGYLLRGDGLPGTVFADFEAGLPAGWTADGDAISVSDGTDLGLYRVSGWLGGGFLSTFTPGTAFGYRGTVTITSPEFTIEPSAINFLLAGTDDAEQAVVNLLVNGEIVRSATGAGDVLMRWVGWDVSEFNGQTAQLQIVDSTNSADAGFLNVDHILFSDVLMPSGREHANWLDYGPDYYAVRAYRDYDEAENRTVLMGWLGNWEYARWVPTTWGKGVLAMPREIELRTMPGGLRIAQRPIPAFETLRGDTVEVVNVDLDGVRPLTEFAPPRNTYELDVEFAVTDPAARFGLRLAISGRNGITVGYDARTGNLFLDRTRPENASVVPDFAKYVTAPLLPVDGRIHLHIYVDQSSVEVFADDGALVLSAVMFPSATSTGIELFAEGGTAQLTHLQAWELASIWETP
jgi:sucrose-6-phosphate hydrolase SacC (GH32 family)